jgi:hypothetical protein
MGSAGRAHVVSKFDYHVVTSRFIEMIGKHLGGL